MAKLTIHAGDFAIGAGHEYAFGNLRLLRPNKLWSVEVVPTSELEEVAVATEESVKRLGGTVGWGVVGGALLGPVGLLAGLLAGGRGKDVTFTARLKDGRKFLATTDAKTYTKISAATF